MEAGGARITGASQAMALLKCFVGELTFQVTLSRRATGHS